MACARRDVDCLRHPAAFATRRRFDSRLATEYLRVRPGGTFAFASGSEPIRAVGKFAPDHLRPRPGKLRISQTLYGRVEHRRRALQLRLLDHSTPRFLSLVGGQG